MLKDSKAERWANRPVRFKVRRFLNVVQAFTGGMISFRQFMFALNDPVNVTAVVIRPARGGGMLLVCPEAQEIAFGTGA